LTDFVIYQLSAITSLLSIQYCTGLLVIYKGIKVNYTRKINHFAIFFIPVLMTFVDAFSPHTWDTPALFFAGYCALYGIGQI